ncbi:MAG TPA: NACHT domain-containing protein, partial [Pyrinomonadaceae bacterium]|nr:NACHT domain-containing protein [Pyrinomonadaceae bacterium]
MDNSISELYDWARKNPALVLSGLSLVVATLGFLLTHSTRLRNGLRQVVLSVGGRLGFTRARYKAAFLKTYRELRNIYLDRIEQLDILATYVPLNVLSEAAGHVNQPAINVLLDAELNRIVILGDPGTGKTTLLKSFGVSLASNDYQRKHQARKGQEERPNHGRDLTPIYVELRDFANQLEKYPTLAEYIIGYILSRQLGGSDARTFLHRLLTRKECVVLLDALDEVGEDEYEAVRKAVHVFMSDTAESLPTTKARVVLTSRHQNFLNIYGDWIPSAFPRYYVLAPFSDDDIQRFLHNRADDLPPGKTPNALWEDIRDSNTLDLHRTPLILTVSLGLYKIIPRYTIPESVARFYEEITKELLQRHDFRTRPYLSKRNVFPSEFKLQFLREFALKAATRPGRFDEFSYEEMGEAFGDLCRRNSRLSPDDRESFLHEIIDNAGLLRRVSDSGTYVFAHRSFHEYFTALQLSKTAEQGAADLIERAESPLWRQVIIFFSTLDHDKHDRLLQGLAERNPELAGYCLAVTINVSPEVAQSVVDRLSAVAARSNAVSILGALSAVCRNAGEQVRERALGVILRILRHVLVLEGATALLGLGLSRDDLIRLSRSLAATGARNIVQSCVSISRLVEDDPRIVPT